MKNRKITLSEKEIPEKWYNIVADMPNKEVTAEKWVDIPDEVRHIYSMWRPTPLYRAYGLEKALDTPAKIYYKYEGVSPSGSHKPNTAVPQAYYNKQEGIKRITTETGAGQWGSALAFACNHFDLECEVYMVRLAADPDTTGSLGIAISEAVERAATNDDTKYALGSVLNHVKLHQTIVGQEAVKQMEKAGDMPDIVIAPFGGGSNFAGLSFPFLRLNFEEGRNIRCIASEPTSCPKLTRGVFRYDFGDTVGMTPLLPMYTLGHNFVPAPIHAGGLRYHGAGVIVSQLLKDKLIEAVAHDNIEVFEAGVLFARTEGIIPARRYHSRT